MTSDIESLIAEQIAFYRADAHAYETWHREVFERGGGGSFGAVCRRDRDRVLAALEQFEPTGHVLELAAGTGSYTSALLRRADRVTALDVSRESLELSRSRLAGDDERVHFVEADLFAWQPMRRYDAVFFAYWLSHVPNDRFEAFWELVGRALSRTGRVFFVDSLGGRANPGTSGTGRVSYSERDDPESQTSVRALEGRSYRVVKVVHRPADLERRLAALGWRARVRPGELCFWGTARFEP